MKNKIKKSVLTLAALGALALGGSALAAGGTGNHAQPAQNTPGATQGEQSGEQAGTEAPDRGEAADSKSGPDTDNVQQGDQSGPDTGEKPGDESGSEAPNNDGPGGHADEAPNGAPAK